ncbi:hypothetical protein L6164_018939 [Bauhinia variegata]|uniref:Uncharacterized protein n=1 Tax=Bauhinia variegata TaxID=167791 RepID=A0ACB9NCW1_BAUVA|nr:hypothetical protein L6164_018939 [Bauhinia variegata]
MKFSNKCGQKEQGHNMISMTSIFRNDQGSPCFIIFDSHSLLAESSPCGSYGKKLNQHGYRASAKIKIATNVPVFLFSQQDRDTLPSTANGAKLINLCLIFLFSSCNNDEVLLLSPLSYSN